MESIWIIHLEVVAFVDTAPDQGKYGFVNVVAAASNASLAEAKVRSVLEEYGWQVLGIEDVWEADSRTGYADELVELIHDVTANADFVRLSTLHVYKLT